MPDSHRLLVIRVERDDAYIKSLEIAVLEAEEKVKAQLDSIIRKVV
jgi:hypothetical protein